jgi:hypothetical protein
LFLRNESLYDYRAQGIGPRLSGRSGKIIPNNFKGNKAGFAAWAAFGDRRACSAPVFDAFKSACRRKVPPHYPLRRLSRCPVGANQSVLPVNG